ncbi:MAG: dUTP diphosphatase [Antricoccus sp.]
MPAIPIPLRRLDLDLPVPSYAHPGDAGVDLFARQSIALPVGMRALVPTGICLELPPGYVGLVHPRSGLAARTGVTVLNAPGTIDSGYRGEIQVNLINLGQQDVHIARCDRIAQLLIQRIEYATFDIVEQLAGSARGTEGHGSTGR